MKKTILLLAAATIFSLGTGAAFAQPVPDPDGYYSRTDHDGYYDRDGHYQHFPEDRGGYDDRGGPPPGDDRGPPPGYDRDGDRDDGYGGDCRRGSAAGTVFGAAGGGLIGGAASHGNPAAIVGGVLLGGLLGNALSRDVDCDDQRYAFDSYAEGLNGDIGHRYDWRHGESYGYFTPTREYNDDGMRCRDFTIDTFRHGEEFKHDGSACYGQDGNWHFR